MTSVNEFLWVVVSRSWADKDVPIQLKIQTMIFSSTTTMSHQSGQSVRLILWVKRTAETIRRLKLNLSSSHATKTSKEIEVTQTAVEAATETVNDTQMAATKVTTHENRVSISLWKRSDRKSKTQRNSGRIYRTRRATVTNSRPLVTVIAAGMVKPSTGENFNAEFLFFSIQTGKFIADISHRQSPQMFHQTQTCGKIKSLHNKFTFSKPLSITWKTPTMAMTSSGPTQVN